jgi:hypothetical protein
MVYDGIMGHGKSSEKTWVLLGFRCADELVVFFTSPMKWVSF